MKKYLFVLLGLFLAGMCLTGLFSGDFLLMAIGCGFGYWSWRAFKAAGRLAPPAEDKPRPWEH